MGTRTNGGTGILAIWNNCAPGREAEYEHWYQTEHLAERLSVPGFLRGRRYEAVNGEPTYFTYYETESPEVLQSDRYVERINNPTPMTEEVMSSVFTDISRTACRRIAQCGKMRGAFAVTVRLSNEVEPRLLEHFLNEFGDDVDLARAEIWIARPNSGSAPSKEEALRGGDDQIAACIVFEFLREASSQLAANRLDSMHPDAQVGAYRLLCELQNENSSNEPAHAVQG